MVNKWRDVRNSKNMKKVYNVALHSVMRILTQCSLQGNALSALVVCLRWSSIVVSTGICRMYIYMNNLLNQFITAQEMDFLVIRLLLFSLLYLSSSIAGEVGDEKFWKNHRLLLHIPAGSYPNFSSICSLQLKRWISRLLAHYSHFYIFPVLLLEK